MKKTSNVLTWFILCALLVACGMRKSVRHKPDLAGYNDNIPNVEEHHDSLFSAANNYLIKNKHGQWELYVKGDALERGLLIGSLADSLLYKQEKAFFEKIEEIVPSQKKQKRLRKFLQWYNRELYKHVPEEYKVEIYGLSRHVSDRYDHIAPPYIRSLYLHAAHDIGHALQDLALVQCTSTALWGDETSDGELLIGRNLDFYAGDKFAEEKLISFVNPEKGIPFMSMGWPGMLGVISGMNLNGLTITMNAGKSDIPLKAKKPITLLAREILQYASTIEEAIKIAEGSEVFVSESLMIGSAKDKKAVLIELTPDKMDIYEVNGGNRLICSNHFQSETFKEEKKNLKHIEESHSQYRYERMTELLNDTSKVTPDIMADVLRNKNGLNDEKIGYGNEKAINQLLSHHAIIFKPESRMVWVSSSPYHLGEFTAYDLNEIFGEKSQDLETMFIDSLTIPEDDFVNSEKFKDYEKYRKMDRLVDKALKAEEPESVEFGLEDIETYQQLNPNHWVVYFKAGLLYYNAEQYEKAKEEFEKALQMEITTVQDVENVQKYLKKTNRKLK